MASDPASDMVRWVRDGEHLFGTVLHTLQRYQEVAARAESLSHENQQLRREIQVLREEVECFRSDRVQVAETLKAFAEQVTRLATLAIQRLGARSSPP